ncbi:50S ribosomal protein L23 [unidentified bacterial endosymbiont]|uniref:50S ribosomal protein L23 n=1 Tax=unidentified bacterial endosymbiont TaxID=2355 RepID=UPI0020A1343A|nr:50S ribosomal protein L23 [unidentified bacterial endosymbiont]
MISEERLLRVLRSPHISEKATRVHEKNNTVIFKVAKEATKAQIKAAIKKLFSTDVQSVQTLIVKGKVKRRGGRVGRCSDWKKAYVTLKAGQSIALPDGTQ